MKSIDGELGSNELSVSSPRSTRRLAGIAVAAALLALVSGAWSVHARSVDRAERDRARGARSFTNPPPPPAPPIHARVGERWTFQVASLHHATDAKGSETWDVLEVTSSAVKLHITPAGGGAPSLRNWSFETPRAERIVRAERDVVPIGDRSFVCDKALVVAPGGEDWLDVWIAVDPSTDSPTFPGVVRLERTESRGRRVVEWDLVGIAPVGSH